MPTITLTNNETSLYLHATATDMVKGESDIKYYAKNTSCGDNVACHEAAPVNHNIATFTVDGGDTDAKYHCTGTLNLSITEGEEDIKAGDMFLVLKNLTSESDSKEEDLKSATGTYNIAFDMTGDGTHNITADVYLVNKSTEEEGQQNYLAGKTISATLSSSDLKCELVGAGA